jgi:hypothetical protein
MLLGTFAQLVLFIPQLSAIVLPGPDPLEDAPRNPWVLAEDPSWTCSAIGDLYFPAGRVRSVRWYTDGESGPGDPGGWEKRAVLTFDDQGRCVEVESWSMGRLRYRERLQPANSSDCERLLQWDGPSCATSWVHEPIRDLSGRELATRVTTWPAQALDGKDVESWIEREYSYDGAGRLVRLIEIGLPGSPNVTRSEFARDEAGRVRRVRFEVTGSGKSGTTDLEYDARGRVIAQCKRLDDGTRYSTCTEYDDENRVVEMSSATDGAIYRVVRWRYDESGRLRSRWIFDQPGTIGGSRQEARTTEETYDGADRPQTRLVRNARGQSIEHYRWGYANDDRGNWTRRIAHRLESELLEIGNEYDDVRRDIEYTD